MIEALRGLGYSTATALADLIDNSIAAEAHCVSLTFAAQGIESYISVLDDGKRMTDQELESAMRLGERSPTDPRGATDLGRFGLGLKTASFSQCRRLTVASKKAGRVSCLRWDLDVLANSKDGGWHLLEGPAEQSADQLACLDALESGTLVLWEVLDRIVTPGFSPQEFLDLMDLADAHLGMVFHRYVEGPRAPLKIEINGRSVGPLDPFLRDHPFTWKSPVERIGPGPDFVEIQGFVLPHRANVSDREFTEAAGPNGWTAHQGFYVYRNRRLLVAGSWLGLGHGRAWTKEEAYRLARLRIDIPNSSDAEWKIDIRKSTARPPLAIRSKLLKLAEDTRERARRVFAHRGQVVRLPGQAAVEEGWVAEQSAGGVRYRVNKEHPAVRLVLEEAGDLAPRIQAMLRVVEETVPVQRIWLDTTEAKEVPETGFSSEPPAEVAEVLGVLYRNFRLIKGMSAQLAKERLLHTEPFQNFPALIASLPDNLNGEPGEHQR